MDRRAYETGVKLHFIRPGKPTENTFMESFKGRFRSDCLDQRWFLDLADARAKVAEWVTDYNEDRPHSSLGGFAPKEYAAQFNNPGLTLREA